jgi:O-antigen ligase
MAAKLVALLALLTLAAEAAWPAESWIWPLTRAVLFFVAGLVSRSMLGWAAACALIAWQGWVGLDWAVAILIGVEMRLNRAALTWVALGVAICGIAAMAWNREWGPLPFANRNHFAVFVEIVLPFLAWRAMREGAKGAMFAAALLLAVSFAAGSRMGAVLLCAEILWLSLQWGGGRKLFWSMGAMGCLISLFVLLTPRERIERPLEGDHRLEIWSAAKNMILAKPLRGWGGDRFPTEYGAFAEFDNGQRVNAVHSDWLEWMVEWGLPGLLLPLGALIWYLRRFAQSLAVWGILFGALHACVDFPWQQPGFLVLTALLAGSFSAYAQKTSHPLPSPAQSANVA